MPKTLKIRIGDNWHIVVVPDIASSPLRVTVDGEPVDVDIEGIDELTSINTPRVSPIPVSQTERIETLSAPLPGIIVSVSVKVGDQVSRGDEICILEAMKMHQSLRSEWAGTVRTVFVTQGQHVGGREAIAEIIVG